MMKVSWGGRRRGGGGGYKGVPWGGVYGGRWFY